MDIVKNDTRGKTGSGTEYTVASFRPTKKILPAERVSLVKNIKATRRPFFSLKNFIKNL